jgi:hypothetical protein
MSAWLRNQFVQLRGHALAYVALVASSRQIIISSPRTADMGGLVAAHTRLLL